MKNEKLRKLEKILKGLDSVVVAYSGGVDSTFLLKMAIFVLGRKKVLAVIAKSETYPSGECAQAKKTAEKLSAPYKIIHTRELDIKNFKENPIDRCYFCKKELFGKLKKLAKKHRLNNVIDGSNFDDLSDWRAGSIAAKELGIRSPLIEAGLAKKDIRSLSRRLGLPTWDKSSLACLASRIPYNHRITEKKLVMIDRAEAFLKDLGFRQVRVRCYDRLARIEVEPDSITKAVKLRERIIKRFKSLGFVYITLDLAGYRTGSMNETMGVSQARNYNISKQLRQIPLV